MQPLSLQLLPFAGERCIGSGRDMQQHEISERTLTLSRKNTIELCVFLHCGIFAGKAGNA